MSYRRISGGIEHEDEGKKTQKTPQREIKLAKARRVDFLERAGKDEDVK